MNVLLIDGENFVHGIVDALKRGKAIRQRAQLHKIDMRVLLKSLAGVREVRCYITRIQMPPKQHKLFDKAEAMRLWNSRWIPYLANQGVAFVRSGLLKVRDSKTCAHCGKKTAVLLEKGVDVRLGVDVVSLAAKGVTMYVWSSDSDLIPAYNAAKALGAKVVYVAIEGQVNQAVTRVASKTVIVPQEHVMRAYRKANDGK